MKSSKWLVLVCALAGLVLVWAITGFDLTMVRLQLDAEKPEVDSVRVKVDYSRSYRAAIMHPPYVEATPEFARPELLDYLAKKETAGVGTIWRKFYLVRFKSSKKAGDVRAWMQKHSIRPASPKEVLALGYSHGPKTGFCLGDGLVSILPIEADSYSRLLFLECKSLIYQWAPDTPQLPVYRVHLTAKGDRGYMETVTFNDRDWFIAVKE